MPLSRRLLRAAIVAVALACATVAPGGAQEIGAYVGGGEGGLRDVRRPFGGGVSATLMFHDWIGIRGDAGYYWTVENRIGCFAVPLVAEAGSRCVTARISSHSHFPLFDGLAVLRAHIPGKGVRFEVGAGPSWVNVTSDIRANSDSLLHTHVSSSRIGAMFMAGILAHPQWRIPVTLEAQYVYHMSDTFGACTNQLNDPICGQRLDFHELRFSILYRLRPVSP